MSLGIADGLTSNFLKNNSVCNFIDKYKNMDFSHLGESTETNETTGTAATPAKAANSEDKN